MNDWTATPPTDLREKLAQLIMVRIGSNMPPIRKVEEDAERISRLLADCPVGGLCLFNGQWPTTTDTLAQLQSLSKYPMLVASDIERGAGQQIHGRALYPHAMAMDALGDDAEAAVFEFGEITGTEAIACGIHAAFAPVADVNTDPRNPIIATRAFGTDPDRVAQHVCNFIRGAQSAGLLTTAKHFPGHGHTHQDSHDELPIVDRPRNVMDASDLLPFRAAIECGVPIIMTAHVAYPQLDASGAPATLSRPILHDLLRTELGFQGVVCSDSLLMAGVRDRFADEGDLVVAALNAGVDVLLDVENAPAAVDHLQQAVESGAVRSARVDEALERVWQLKQNMRLTRPKQLPVKRRATEAARQVARRAIVQLGESSGPSPLPLAGDDDLLALLLMPNVPVADTPDSPFAAALETRFPSARCVELGPAADPAALDHALAEALAAKHLIIAMVVKPNAWHRFGLLSEQTQLVEALVAQRPAILVSLGSPHILHEFPQATLRLCTFSDVPVSQEALVDLLASGRLAAL